MPRRARIRAIEVRRGDLDEREAGEDEAASASVAELRAELERALELGLGRRYAPVGEVHVGAPDERRRDALIIVRG